MVAGRPFHELLTSQRRGADPRGADALDQRCREHGRDGLGIRLDGLSLHDLHPPQEVVPAYYEVTRAMEARDREINQAQAAVLYKPRDLAQSAQVLAQAEKDGGRLDLSLTEADALALQTVRRAEAARAEKVDAAEAGRDVFLARDRARAELSAEAEWLLRSTPSGRFARGKAPAAAYDGVPARSARNCWRSQPVLTDFRLFWTALGRVAGRPRQDDHRRRRRCRAVRNLLLMDPEQFRVPVPILTPRGERGGPGEGP